MRRKNRKNPEGIARGRNPTTRSRVVGRRNPSETEFSQQGNRRRREFQINPNTPSAIRAAEKHNKQAQWETYRSLERQTEKALDKLRSDIQRRASPQVILRDRNALMLLLGECDYMTRECSRVASQTRRHSAHHPHRRRVGKRA